MCHKPSVSDNFVFGVAMLIGAVMFGLMVTDSLP